MKILKEGKLPEGTVRFECKVCSCVFLAGPTEWSSKANTYHEFYQVATCPCCGNEVFTPKGTQKLNRGSGY